MLALVDSDTPVFSTALVSEDVNEAIAKSRLDVCISTILRDCGANEFKLFVSGGRNFRKDIDPSYKANRTLPDPKHRETLRQHLIKDWGAYECVGYEADDQCGIEQKQDGSTIIVAIDKDLLQVPGLHYSWPIVRKGQVLRDHRWLEIDEETGFRNFFTQALTGDTSDNIKGIYGIGEKKAEKLLANCHTEEEMYDAVDAIYFESAVFDDNVIKNQAAEIERLTRNLDLLWIWRSLGVTYTTRKEING